MYNYNKIFDQQKSRRHCKGPNFVIMFVSGLKTAFLPKIHFERCVNNNIIDTSKLNRIMLIILVQIVII